MSIPPGRAKEPQAGPGNGFDDGKVEELLRAGQVAFHATRWRISGGLVVAGVLAGAAQMAMLMDSRHVLNEEDAVSYTPVDHVLLSVVFLLRALRFTFLNLAPFADDVVLTRCVLALDTIFWTVDAGCSDTHLVISVGKAFMSVGWVWAGMGARVQVQQARMWRVAAAGLIFATVVSSVRAVVVAWRYRAVFPSAWFAVLAAAFLRIYVAEDLRGAIHARLRKCAQRRSAVRAAAGIAGLVGRCRPGEVLLQASTRFRSIELGSLTIEDLRSSVPEPRLFALSSPARLGECDAFISHSWQDDADAKWRALTAWCQQFQRTHGREPTLWFDKCCIDQDDIEANLKCLPMFVRGCRRFVALCGKTYLERLWCIIEIFTYFHVGSDIGNFEIIQVWPTGAEVESAECIARAFETFNVQNCKCSVPADLERMLVILKAAFGSLDAFNERLRAVMPKLDEFGLLAPQCTDKGGAQAASM